MAHMPKIRTTSPHRHITSTSSVSGQTATIMNETMELLFDTKKATGILFCLFISLSKARRFRRDGYRSHSSNIY